MVSISLSYARAAARRKAFESSKLRPLTAAYANVSGDITVTEAVSTTNVVHGKSSASTATSISATSGTLVVLTSHTTASKRS